MASMECSICTENFTLSLRKKVHCAKCEAVACLSCYKKYICETINDPHCMFCKNFWDMDFVYSTFSYHFMNTLWKESRGNVLFSREQSYFPATMEVIERMVKVEDIEKLKIGIYHQIDDLKRQIDIHNQNIKKILNKNLKQTTETSRFSNRLCITENCKGILEKRTGECILCSKTTCISCNTPKLNDEHECKKEDIDTWEMINRGSKPCPICSTLIFKNGGCDQMWCIQCHTAFSWKTGVVENRRIHNPHYFEYLRANPHLNNQNPEREHDECENIWRPNTYPLLLRTNKQFLDILQFLSHNVNATLHYYRGQSIVNNQKHRVNFLRNITTETVFKKALVSAENYANKNRRFVDIFHTFEIISRNILNDIRQSKNSFVEFKVEVRKLIDFTNLQIAEYNTKFHTNERELELTLF